MFVDVGPEGVGSGAWGKQWMVGDAVTTGEKTRRKQGNREEERMVG